MSRENNNSETSETRRSTDGTKKFSEDAFGLGPRQVGPIGIGVVDMIVSDGGVEVPGFVVTKNEMLQPVRYWAKKIIDLDFVFLLNGGKNTISELIGEEEVTKAFR
jgi:hypothetical protein